MKAILWRVCEIRIGGCKRTPDYLVHIEPTNEMFKPKKKRLLACQNCKDYYDNCKLATTEVMMNLRELREELLT